MASWRTDDSGFATPMAMTMSLALTVMVGALAAAAMQELAAARDDLDRARAEYALAGAHLQAAVELEHAAPRDRFRWTRNTDVGPAEILAEAEQSKLSYATASELPADRLRTLGAAEPEQARRLLADAVGRRVLDAGLGQPCAASVISAFGSSKRISAATPDAPQPSLNGQSLVGQVWRLRVSAGGWVDDRIVRFTGDGRRPAGVIRRRLTRGENLGGRCDTVLTTLAG